jgi:hypothetical protein
MEEGGRTDRATEAPFPARRVRLWRPTLAEDGGIETGKRPGFDEAGDWSIAASPSGSSMNTMKGKIGENKRIDFGVLDRIASIFGGSWERFWECLKYSSEIELDIYN